MKKNPAPTSTVRLAPSDAPLGLDKAPKRQEETQEAAWEQVQTLIRICSLRAAAEFEDMARECRR